MKSTIHLLSRCVFVWLLMLTSCSKDETKVDECKGNGTLSVTINGNEWIASDFNNTLLISNSLGTASKRLDIRAINKHNKILDISVTDLTTVDSCMSASATYTAFGDIVIDTENTFLFTYLDANGNTLAQAVDGTLDITNCDEANTTVSGTFTFEGLYYDSNDFIGVSGTFSDVCYRIIK